MIYSIPYLIFLIYLLTLAVIISEKKEDDQLCRNLTNLGIASFLVFFGCRGYIWHDWTAYTGLFDKASWSDIANYNYFKHSEPLWFVLMRTFKTFVNNYYAFAFLCSLINTILLVRFFKRYSISLLFALATYVAFSGFEISINLMRNSMAMFIVLNALPYIEERKIGKYMLACAVAAGIHLSSLVYIPLYFILNRQINKWVFIGLVIACNAVLFSNIAIVMKLAEAIGFNNEIFESKLSIYSDFGMYASSRFVLLQRFLICLMVFCYYDKLTEMSKSNRMFINALLIYIIGSYLTSEFSEMSNRIGILFSFSFWILCGYLIKCCFYINNRRLFMGFMGFVLMFNTYITTAENIKEYQNWLFGTADSYEAKRSFYNKNFSETKQVDSKKK
ncbi:MAG: EpsG family protein [Bacteroidales bacterium]|nr:EpsG family protein [Bacteroidales bacterium]MCM1146583.1 EpsG family protein [Bacteroidales bacterium]MCM1205975.1 EpsG family protein [Bacillota bacterium]MCM1510144.1 EpsG family protein [Clostridium sp.]